MRWSYKTVHYELKKDGFLGSAFLDESEVEISLNEYGKAGWELVSLLETLDGLTAVFKQPLSLDSGTSDSTFIPSGLGKPQAVKGEHEFVEKVEQKNEEESAEDCDIFLSDEKQRPVTDKLDEKLEELVLWEDEEDRKRQPPSNKKIKNAVEDADTDVDIGSIRIE